jgi:hypothetical protein
MERPAHHGCRFVERCNDLLSELVNAATLAGAPRAAAAPAAATGNSGSGGDAGGRPPAAALSADVLLDEEPHLVDVRRRLEAQRDTLHEARRLLATF